MPQQTNPGTRRLSPGKKVVGRPSSGGQGSPHDSLFRWIFGKPQNAASQVRSVMPELTTRLDLARLSLEPGTFVDEALKQRHTDVLLSAPLDGEDAFVYLLMEHQSSNDHLMAFRLLRYIVRVWDRYLEENPRARELPAVIPLVVYNGKSTWSAPLRLQDLIAPAPGGNDAEYVPRFSFRLDDLNIIAPGQLRDQDLTFQAMTGKLALKIAPGNPRIGEDLLDWNDELRAALDEPGGREYFIALLTYIMGVGVTPGDEIGSLSESLGPDAKEAFVTTAEMLEARGEVRGAARLLIDVLTDKFGALPEARSKQVSEASADQIKKWAIRASNAQTLDEVFD